MRNLFLVFLVFSFLNPVLADDKSIAILAPTAVSLPVVRPTFAYSSSAPVEIKKWVTYKNLKYGFSVQYPLAQVFRPPRINRNCWAESEIHLPTVYDSGLVTLSTYSDKGVREYDNALRTSDGDTFDSEFYPYSLKS